MPPISNQYLPEITLVILPVLTQAIIFTFLIPDAVPPITPPTYLALLLVEERAISAELEQYSTVELAVMVPTTAPIFVVLAVIPEQSIVPSKCTFLIVPAYR